MSKEAMKLAQKAIEAHNSGDWDAASELFDEALPALRKALANEALDRVSENARELGLDYGVEQDLRVFARVDAMRAKGLLKLTATLEQPAQPQPVAHQYSEMRDDGTWSAWLGCDKPLLANEQRRVRALYTSPPAQRKPLTDEQLAELTKDGYYDNLLWSGVKRFARAIEAAHGIKGDA